jgi:hypothetical protein
LEHPHVRDILTGNMLKHLRFVLLCGLALMAGVSSAQKPVKVVKVAAKPISVVVGDTPITFDGAQPQEIMGRIMVPLRGVFEKIGAYVEYNAATHLITAHYQNQSVEIKMGDKIANVNGAEIMMEVPACIIRGNALVPLRFLAESIGAQVNYDQPTNTVTITMTDTSFGGKDGSTGGGSGGGTLQDPLAK